jgi:hypothetical protein
MVAEQLLSVLFFTRSVRLFFVSARIVFEK